MSRAVRCISLALVLAIVASAPPGFLHGACDGITFWTPGPIRLTATPATLLIRDGLGTGTLSASLPPGPDAFITWEKVSGPEGDIVGAPSSATTPIAVEQPGSYTYRIRLGYRCAEPSSLEATVRFSAETDCNGNGVPDRTDISGGASVDANDDGVPDECQAFRRGDANQDGEFDLSDGVEILEFLFLPGESLGCSRSADTNADGEIDISDAINVLGVLFLGVGTIPAPFPTCGTGSESTTLSCETAGSC